MLLLLRKSPGRIGLGRERVGELIAELQAAFPVSLDQVRMLMALQDFRRAVVNDMDLPMRAKSAVCWVLGLSLGFGVAASVQAQPVKLVAPLEKLETVEGPAMVRRAGQALVMTFIGQGGHDRWFRVEAFKGAGLPASFHADSAEVLYWMGHLVLMSGDKAWYFSVPKGDEFLPATAQVPRGAELDSLLRGYEVTQIEASAIYSASGPRADRLNGGMKGLFSNQDDQQDPGGGGVGSCGLSCSIQCGAGSSCSANCSPPRCATCTCPASCSCS